MRDDKQQQLKIELLSQWKLEAESRNIEMKSNVYFEREIDKYTRSMILSNINLVLSLSLAKS